MAVLCKSCGTTLVFDPKLQKLSCRSCGGTQEYSSVSDTDKYEQDLYTCSTCGAELLANETDLTLFCQNCGNTHLVHNRIVKSKKPDKIIPFRITQEEAEQKLKDHIDKYAFIDKRVKDLKFDCVRGIYIPYYVLSEVQFQGTYIYAIDVRDSEGNVTDKKEIPISATTTFRAVTLEASASINDDLSIDLDPFDTKEMVDFNPGYLQGFYSDISDDDAENLYKKTQKMLTTMVLDELSAKQPKESYVLASDHRLKFVGTPVYALFPVWFLTTTFNGKPLTLLVNGQTGKVVGGLPYDKKKFSLVTALFSLVLIPLFVAAIFGLLVAPTIAVSLLILAFFSGFFINKSNRRLELIKEKIEQSSSRRLFKFTSRRT